MRRFFIVLSGTCGLAGAGVQSAEAADSYRAPTYYYVPGSAYAPAPGPKGALAAAPVELLEGPPAAVEGEMSIGDVIGRHGLRAIEARVLLAPVAGGRRQLPAGTALAKVTINRGMGTTVWCDIRAWGGEGRRAEHDCLADSRNRGVFDQLWLGESPGYFLGPGVNVVRSPRTLPQPVAYRQARPDERPRGLLGYRWCGGDAVSSPPRFAPAVTASGDKLWTSDPARGCALGVWVDVSGTRQLDVDGHVLHVEPTEKPGVLRYRFVDEDMPAGPVAKVSLGQGPEAARLASQPSGSGTPLATPALRALVAAGAGPATVSGPLAKGQAFFTVGVKHGLTGVLKNEVQGHAWLSDRKLPFDQPLYGVPMAGSSGPGIVWCAPQAKAGDGKTKVWSASCLVDGGGKYVWVNARPALMTLDLHWTEGGGRTATPPSVERRAVELPAMSLSYAFGGWNKQHWLVVDMQIDWGEGPQTLRSISVPPAEDGAAILRVMGADIRVRPGPSKSSTQIEQAVVEVLTAPHEGGDIPY